MVRLPRQFAVDGVEQRRADVRGRRPVLARLDILIGARIAPEIARLAITSNPAFSAAPSVIDPWPSLTLARMPARRPAVFRQTPVCGSLA